MSQKWPCRRKFTSYVFIMIIIAIEYFPTHLNFLKKQLGNLKSDLANPI